MMDITAGVAAVAGIGTVLGTAVEHKKMSSTGQIAGYLTGASLILFSLYEHMEHKKKMRHKWLEHMRRSRRPPSCAPADYRIVGGHESGDYNYMHKQKNMAMAQAAGSHMWPRREPRGYLTGQGMENRGIPGASLYQYPDSIYEYGRSRITPSAYA